MVNGAFFKQIQSYFVNHPLRAVATSLYYKVFCRAQIHLQRYFNVAEQCEYKLFLQMKRLQTQKNELLQESSFHSVLEQTDKLFAKTHRIDHIKRLNPRITEDELAQQPLMISKGFKKEQVELHETYEMLSMKWDYGVDFRNPYSGFFLQAHKKACQLENQFRLAKAQSLHLPLSSKAVNYFRIADECSFPFDVSYKDGKSFLEKEQAVKWLTKNKESLPKAEEIEEYLHFIAETNDYIVPEEVSETKKTLYHRYLFTTFEKRYSDDKNILFFLLRMMERDATYDRFALRELEDKFAAFSRVLLEDYEKEQVNALCEEDAYDFFKKSPEKTPLGAISKKLFYEKFLRDGV